jgi:hypothetical protein
MATRRGPDNSVRFAMSGTLRAQSWANVFHMQLTTSSSIAQADLDTWTAAVALAWETRFKGLVGTDLTTTLAKATLYTPGGTVLQSTSARSQAGTAAGTSMAGSPASVVSWGTTVYWRGGKPRMYLAGITSGAINAGADTLATSHKTALKTAADGFRTDVNALTAGTITGSQLGFVSFSSGNAPRVTPLFFAVNPSTIHSRVGSQRRRDGKWIN